MKTANVACVFAVALPLLLKDAWRLTALKLADERARALGVHVDGLKLRLHTGCASGNSRNPLPFRAFGPDLPSCRPTAAIRSRSAEPLRSTRTCRSSSQR